DSGNSTKTFQDEIITITPGSATNPVNAPHTVTATVFLNTGDGTGFHPFQGTSVTISLINQNGAVASPAGPFTGTTNASGQFQVTFTSATAGTVISVATTSLIVNGTTITRTTGDGYTTVGGSDSASATKTFVGPSVSSISGNVFIDPAQNNFTPGDVL